MIIEKSSYVRKYSNSDLHCLVNTYQLSFIILLTHSPEHYTDNIYAQGLGKTARSLAAIIRARYYNNSFLEPPQGVIP